MAGKDLDSMSDQELSDHIAKLKLQREEMNKKTEDRKLIGAIESGLAGVAQGATFGFADELAALGKSALGDKSYDQELADLRDYFDAARQTNPTAYGAGDIGASVATSFVPGGAIGNIAKAAGAAGRGGAFLSRGLAGAVPGFVEGIGRARDGESSLVEGLKSGALGFGAGLVGGNIASRFSKQEAALVGSAMSAGSNEVGEKVGQYILNTGSRPILKAALGESGPQARKLVRDMAFSLAEKAKPVVRNADDAFKAQLKYQKAIADTEDKIAELVGEQANNFAKARVDGIGGLLGLAASTVKAPFMAIKSVGSGLVSAGSGAARSAASNFAGDRMVSGIAAGGSGGMAASVQDNLFAPENDEYLRNQLQVP